MKTSIPFLATLLLLCNFSFGQENFKKIDSIIKDNYQKNPGLGISVGFIQNDKENFTAYGKLSKESQIDINEKSLFEIASITKILTSNLIAQAVLENKIKLDDYIDNYLPKVYVLHENLKNKIKISDLASHQSGLPDLDFGKLIEINVQQPLNSVNENSLTTLVNNSTQLIDYGKYRYSTIGYTLLGQILETVYGKSYDAIITQKIIEPLKLKTTLTKKYNVKNKTVGHSPEGVNQEFLNWNVTASAGLIKSNAFDMITYLKAVLNKETTIGKAAIITEKIFYKDEKREMGLAVNISTSDGDTIYLKSGDSMGESSIICYSRTKNWGIILLLNQRNSKLRQDMLNVIYGTILK
jgi:CubicO group peptidase (beta-lactamase class C family)